MKAEKVIIISEVNDSVTDTIIEYLNFYDTPHIRINQEDYFKDFTLELNDGMNEINISNINENILFNENTFIYYRRGEVAKQYPFFKEKKIKKGLENDIETFQYYLNDNVQNKLGERNKEYYTNKLVNLRLAKEVGIEIPATIVTTSKSKILAFLSIHKKVIAKPINNGWYIKDKSLELNFAKTRLLDINFIHNLNSTFALTLFQKYIEKEVELRIFFIYGRFFPMAIFSQQSEKTSVDFRNYDNENPNRCTPFKLPINIEDNLLSLMKKIGLSTGSIDMIVTPNDEFVFLEVNPSGQFEWTSHNCNYYIEKEIALNIKSRTKQ